jgi:molybdopterin converting factor small subunit
MKVRVRIYGDLVAIYGSKHLLMFDGKTTIQTLTKAIAKKAGGSREGYLGEFKIGGTDLAIMVNGKNITLLHGLNTLLKDGDDVVIMPFVVGG